MGITAFPFTAVIDVPTARILGRDDAGTGAAEALTTAEVLALLSVYTTAQVDSLLSGKSNVGHTHTPADITGFGEAVDDEVATLLTAGSGISLSYNDNANTLTIASTVTPGVGGSTGSTANAVLRASGTGGATLQASGVIIDDSANLTTTGFLQVGSATPSTRYEQNAITNFASGARYNIISWTSGIVIDAIRIAGFAYQGIHIERRSGINTWVTINYSMSATGASDATPRQALDVRGNAIIDGNLQCHKGTTAVFIQVYNTYTSDTSFERLNIDWASNICTIAVTAGSAGGTLRGLRIGGASTSLLGFYGVTPVDQPETVAAPTGGTVIDTEARTAISALISRLQETGLVK